MVSLNFGCIFLRLVIRFLILAILNYSPSYDNFEYKIMSHRELVFLEARNFA